MHKDRDKDGSRPSRRRFAWSLFVLILACATTFAHPMGNFSVNHYSKVKIGRQSVEIRYLIDMAEIPTFQEIRQFNIATVPDDPSAARYLDKKGQLLKQGLSLEVDGQAVQLQEISRQLTFADGAGGLPTMKIGFVFRGKLEAASRSHKLSYFDNNFPGRAGWKEIVVLGDGAAILDSSAPATDRSQELTNYSSDVLNSPPQQVSAVTTFKNSFIEPGRNDSARTDPGLMLFHPANPARPAVAIRRPSRSSDAITLPELGGRQISPKIAVSTACIDSPPVCSRIRRAAVSPS